MAGKSNRAALGGMFGTLGFFLLFTSGPMRIMGLLMLLGGLLSVALAFRRG